MRFRNILAIAVTIGAVSCIASAATPPVITYTASGTFASPAVSGNDTMKLAGEPFSVSISVSAATVPTQTGKNWALYTKLKLTGTVHSGLLGSTPVNITSGAASIQQFINPGKPELFVIGAPVKIVGLNLTIRANIILPPNTLAKPLLHPFSAVALTPSNAPLTYSDGTNSTTVAIQKGSLSATVPPPAASSNIAEPVTTARSIVLLHPAAIQAVTLHADGTESAASATAMPVDMGQLSDSVTLKLYASGIADASEVSVQIAGEQVPVLYSGASGHYRGLDQVFVRLPRTLAGRGATEVLLTADGVTSNPVPLYIQ